MINLFYAGLYFAFTIFCIFLIYVNDWDDLSELFMGIAAGVFGFVSFIGGCHHILLSSPDNTIANDIGGIMVFICLVVLFFLFIIKVIMFLLDKYDIRLLDELINIKNDTKEWYNDANLSEYLEDQWGALKRRFTDG